jgi:hypothetical protein
MLHLEEATIHRHVAAVHVQDDDVARGNPHHRIPRAATQQVRAGLADTSPALRLQLCGSEGAERNRHG